MPGAAWSKPGAARLAFEFRRNRREHRFNHAIGLHRTACHDRGAVAGPLMTTRNTNPEDGYAIFRHLPLPPLGFVKVGIARIDDTVTARQCATQLLQHAIDGTRRHKQDHRARCPDHLGEFRHRLCWKNARGQSARPFGEGRDGSPIEAVHRNGEALLRHVEGEVSTHHTKANEADICLHEILSRSAVADTLPE